MRHNFKYFFREGVKNMFSHGFMSFAAIGITVACLLIMGTFTLVAYNANENLKDLQRENAVLAFVDENHVRQRGGGARPAAAARECAERGGLHIRLTRAGARHLC